MKVRTVRAVRDAGVNRGATGSHLVECDDGLTYVVKFSGRSRVAVNEFLGQTLARKLALPLPGSSFVDMSEEMIAHSSDLLNRGILPGLHMGSEAVSNGSSLGEMGRRGSRLDEELVNWEVIPGTVCLDNWILTEDRDRLDNHLLQPVPGGSRYYMVDFTHSFTGPNWTPETLDQGAYLRTLTPVLPSIASSVRGAHSLEPTLSRIERIPDVDLEEVVEAVPASWNLSPEDRSSLARFLQLRRGLLRNAITSNKRLFPNWT